MNLDRAQKKIQSLSNQLAEALQAEGDINPSPSLGKVRRIGTEKVRYSHNKRSAGIELMETI
jgi:hypothetical protein